MIHYADVNEASFAGATSSCIASRRSFAYPLSPPSRAFLRHLLPSQEPTLEALFEKKIFT